MTFTELESPPETAFPCIVCLSWTGTKHLPPFFFNFPFFARVFACFCMYVGTCVWLSVLVEAQGLCQDSSSVTLPPYWLRQVSQSNSELTDMSHLASQLVWGTCPYLPRLDLQIAISSWHSLGPRDANLVLTFTRVL